MKQIKKSASLISRQPITDLEKIKALRSSAKIQGYFLSLPEACELLGIKK